jgi:hypothetical protein
LHIHQYDVEIVAQGLKVFVVGLASVIFASTVATNVLP